MTQFDAAKARRMRADGASWNDIGRAFGVSDFVARGRLDPEWLVRRRRQVNASRRGKYTTSLYVEPKPRGQTVFETPCGPAYAVVKDVHGAWAGQAGNTRYTMRISLPYLSIQRESAPA